MTVQAARLFVERASRQGVPVGAVFNLCRNWGLHPAAARELAEEAAAEAYCRSLVQQDFATYPLCCNWLAKTARNWAIDQLRRRRRLRDLADFDHWVSPIEELDQMAEELPRLQVYLARLSPDDQEVLRLAFVEGLTLDEIAACLEPDGKGTLNARRLRAKRRRDVAIARLRAYFKA